MSGILLRRWVVVLASGVALVGCYRSHPRRDDAAVDARAAATDAEAGVRVEDTGVSLDTGPDAAPDAERPPCVPGSLDWIDREPIERLRETRLAPSLVASRRGFELLYLSHDDSSCGGVCPRLVRLPTEGPSRERHVAAWAQAGAAPTFLAAVVDENGAPAFAAAVGLDVRWIGEPRAGEPEWAVPEATVRFVPGPGSAALNAVGAIALSSTSVFVEAHQAPTAGRYARGAEVRRYSRAGEGELTTFLGVSSETWGAQLAVSPTRRLITAHAEDDFESVPGVVVSFSELGLRETAPTCGQIEAFDVAPASASLGYVVEDCRGQVLLTRVEEGGPPGSLILVSSSHASRSGSPSRIAVAGDRIAVAYRDTSGSLRIAVLGPDLALVASGEVPGAETSSERPPGPMDLAAHEDGTFAVVWTRGTTVAADGGLQRFRVCE